MDRDSLSNDNSNKHKNYFMRSDAYMKRVPGTAEGKKRVRKDVNIHVRNRKYGINSVRKLSPKRMIAFEYQDG